MDAIIKSIQTNTYYHNGTEFLRYTQYMSFWDQGLFYKIRRAQDKYVIRKLNQLTCVDDVKTLFSVYTFPEDEEDIYEIIEYAGGLSLIKLECFTRLHLHGSTRQGKYHTV